MKMYSRGFVVGLVLLLAAAAIWAAPLEESPQLTIASEARCLESIGVPIPEVSDNQVKLACLRDKTVQAECNPDGQHARIQAFRQWHSDLMDFKDRCAEVGGVFGFADPNFKEPANESFCSAADVEVRYGTFEQPHCNFVSRCPPVVLSCARPEDIVQAAPRTVLLPGIPNPVSLQH
jgi:hypothetical protein